MTRRQRIGIAVAAGVLQFAMGHAEAASVRSRSGVSVRVAPAARPKLQCVVDYVEARGVRITAMRGYGRGTVRHSMHPGGRALDINQTDRNVTHPNVPRHVANAAADQCGVVSGARWKNADNGHFNLKVGKQHELSSRVLAAAASRRQARDRVPSFVQ